MSSCRRKRISLVLALASTVSLLPTPPAHAGVDAWLRGLERAARLLEGKDLFSRLLRAFEGDRSGGGMDPNGGGGRNPGNAPPPPPPGNNG